MPEARRPSVLSLASMRYQSPRTVPGLANTVFIAHFVAVAAGRGAPGGAKKRRGSVLKRVHQCKAAAFRPAGPWPTPCPKGMPREIALYNRGLSYGVRPHP